MHAANPYEIARPFLWLAAIGFALGFLGYLLMGGGAQALTRTVPEATPAVAEALSMARDLPREI